MVEVEVGVFDWCYDYVVVLLCSFDVVFCVVLGYYCCVWGEFFFEDFVLVDELLVVFFENVFDLLDELVL